MKINDPAVLAEMEANFASYEAALMANDIETLDGLFWQSPMVLRYGAGENLYGFDAIAAFRGGRVGGSPQRSLAKTVITTFGADFATANTEFFRAGETRIGRQSQSWVRMQEGWKIVAAHVSLMGDRA